MKILAVGGGSGGHVTPVVAVLRALKSAQPSSQIQFWCDRKFYPQARRTIHHFDDSMPVEKIWSGKLRRYNTLSLAEQLTRPDIVFPNIRDMLLVLVGFFQCLVKLVIWRPDVVFTKGGFVCLPVGLAARVLRIPLVIHDSDAHPGLTNRILARFASSIATGAPLKYYNYPKEKSHYVGIPVAPECVPYDATQRQKTKRELGFDEKRPLIVVTGGGLGAKRINDAVVGLLPELLRNMSVLLISGTKHYQELAARTTAYDDKTTFQLQAFMTPLVPVIGAADIVVSRAGATTLLELAAMKKPTILIPNAYLTGGHQLKNAAVYDEAQAVVVVDEDQIDASPELLLVEIKRVLASEQLQSRLAENIYTFARPNAATDVAQLIVAAAKRR